MAGRFVVLEGIDGAGTTTQAARLAAELQRRHSLAVLCTHEPTGGPVGVLLRKALMGEWESAAQTAEQKAALLGLLFAADRLDHVAAELTPALIAGQWVISDRYDHSSVAYQSVSSEGALSVMWLRELNRYASRPDLTIVLDVSPEIARKRRLARDSTRELFDDDLLQKKLAMFYEDLERHFPGERIVHVDGDQDIDAVTCDLLVAMESWLT